MIFALWEKSLSRHSNKWGKFHSWKSIFHPFKATLRGVWKVFLKPKGGAHLSLSLSHSQIRVCGCELRGVYDPHYKQISSLVYFFSFFIFFIFNIATRRRAREGSKNSKATWRKRWFTNHPPKSSSLCNIVTQLLGLLPVSMSFKEFLDHPIPSQCVLHGCGIHI